MFILNLDLDGWLAKWINISNENLGIICFFMIIYNLFYGFFSQNILFVISLDKNISDIFVLNRDFSDLNFSSTVILKSPDSLPALSDN